MSFSLRDFWSFGGSWTGLDTEFDEAGYITELDTFLDEERSNGFFPSPCSIFRAFEETPLERVKVIIIGQDPYADERATGLAFSIPRYAMVPPTLRNIYDEVERDLEHPVANCGDLTHWAKQGVLLLNSVLTVRSGKTGRSHRFRGRWTGFTNRALEVVARAHPNAIYCLWGQQAIAKREHLARKGYAVPRKHVLMASHPSPKTFRNRLGMHSSFARCRHFSQVNNLLMQQEKTPIHW